MLSGHESNSIDSTMELCKCNGFDALGEPAIAIAGPAVANAMFCKKSLVIFR